MPVYKIKLIASSSIKNVLLFYQEIIDNYVKAKYKVGLPKKGTLRIQKKQQKK